MRLLLLTILISLAFLGYSQSHGPISKSFKAGDIAELSKHFNSSIEMNIPENSGLFQKEQAIQLLENFFAENTTKEYKLKHQGGSKQKSQFHIGQLTTDKGSFRTYLLYNTVDGMMQIIELRIEEE